MVILSGFYFGNFIFNKTHPPTLKAVAGVSDETNFNSNINPEFDLDTGGLLQTDQALSGEGELNVGSGLIQAEIYYDSHKINTQVKIKSVLGRKSNFKIEILPGLNFKPGKYTLRINIASQTDQKTISQDFTWGVIALNLDQSSYRISEKTQIGMAVLDDAGRTLCDANLSLKVIDPQGEITALTTADQTIVLSDECQDKSVTNLPDYSTQYQPGSEGIYKIELEAETSNGLRTATENFVVTKNPDFMIRRSDTATRIYPAADYSMKMNVSVNKNFTGEIRERIPASFTINKISSEGQLKREDNYQTIVWPATLGTGENINLSYSYKAPNISPQFYLLGPLQLVTKPETQEIFSEPRSWQIAADTVSTVYATSNSADGALTGWTNPTYAYTDDGVNFATRAGTSKNTWYGTLYGFNLSGIPDNAAINSVTITAEWKNSGNDSSGPVFFVGAKSGGAEVGSGTTDTSGTTSFELTNYSPTGLTAANLKATGASGFWAIMRFRRTDNTTHTASVDYIKVAVDYSTPPTAPSGVNFTSIATTGFRVNWTDNSSDETGFKVYISTTPNADCSLATYPGTPDYTTAAGATYQDVTGKSVNTQYCAKVTATNGAGDSSAAYASGPIYTLANVPGTPTVNTPTSSSLKVIIDVNSNPASTQFAVYNETATQYVKTDGTMQAGEAWDTYANFGGASGVVNTGLSSSTSYTYKVKARNGDNTATTLSTGASNTTLSDNIDPTNDSLSFTNPYTSNIAISDDTTEWNFRALVTDDDGSTNIDYVELRFANAADSSQPYDSLKYRWTESTDTFSEQADTQNAGTITSTNANSNAVGDQWTLDFKIKINNDFASKDTQYAAELYTIDDAAASDNDNYTNKYQVTVLSISLDVDNATLQFGNLLPGSIVTGTTVATVTTNYPNGYTLSASDGVASTNSALLHTDTATRITDYTGTIASPTVWSGTGLGITIWAADTTPEAKWCNDICSSESDPDNKYAGVPETVITIHTKTGSPTSGDDTSVGYKLVVPNTQKTGDYSGDVTYTATGVLL